MRFLKFMLSVPCVCALLSACRGPEGPLAADRILVNGTILTVDNRDTIAEALAIRDGAILAVGTNAEVETLAGPATERIDLQGRTATPGLLDAHCHFAGGGLDLLFELDLSYPNVTSVADAVNKVRDQAAALGDRKWVLGRGWDEGKLQERRYIYATDLDPVSSQNPVWLTHTMGHYGVANSVALRLAKIGRNTPDPTGGTVDRDSQGNPTGVLKESAQALVTNLIPDVTEEQRAAGIRRMVQEFNREGMTGLKDPGIGRETWNAYEKVLGEGKLSVRVFTLWRPGRTLESAQEMLDRLRFPLRDRVAQGSHNLIYGGIKLAIDGSGGARTAWLHSEWNKGFTDTDTGNSGYPVTEPEILRRQIRLFHDADIHVSVHSIGDRAIDWVVDSLDAALQAKPSKGLRHGIIHANIPTDRALEAMARMQRDYDAAYPEPSATFMWWIGDTYAGNFGPDRALRLNPFKSYLDRGMRWADSSDFSVTPFPARYGLWASMARETLLGVHGANPYGREQAVDIRTALRSRTIWAARQMFLEQRIGSLEPGKYADIAVWDRNPYEVSAAEIKEMRCVMTLFQGVVVYRQ